MKHSTSSYSIDSLKYAMFEHELQNEIDLTDDTYRDEEWLAVREYLKKRMKELKRGQ